jgi:acetylxylan esterase
MARQGARLTAALTFVMGAVIVMGIIVMGSGTSQAAATVTQVMSFGTNPTGIGMYLYTPSNVVAKPPILVGVHACHGKGLDVCTSGNPFAQQADKYGFLLICPSAVSSDGCWDVHSMADLSHGGGGDAAGILSMVNYIVQNKNGDVNRVYVAGHSSGGMMTNVLLGSYPDVFKAGAAFAGVPFACFAQGSVDNLGWSSTCANGNVTMTGAAWGALVRAAYPGFTGTRPRIQFWHGTVDATLSFHNFGEEIKEWTNVLGVSETPTSTENDAVQATWIRTRYADGAGVVQVEAVQETGQPHNLVIEGAEAIRFFGLDGSNPVSGAGGGGAPPSKDGGAGSVADGGAPDGGTGADASGGGAAVPVASGGASGTGGVPGTGGRGAVINGTGGAVQPGGGGLLGTGGALATGGSSASPGGPGSGGSSGQPPAGTGGPAAGPSSSEGSSSGCSLASARPQRLGPAGLVLVVAILLSGLRRRRRHRG